MLEKWRFCITIPNIPNPLCIVPPIPRVKFSIENTLSSSQVRWQLSDVCKKKTLCSALFFPARLGSRPTILLFVPPASLLITFLFLSFFHLLNSSPPPSMPKISPPSEVPSHPISVHAISDHTYERSSPSSSNARILTPSTISKPFPKTCSISLSLIHLMHLILYSLLSNKPLCNQRQGLFPLFHIHLPKWERCALKCFDRRIVSYNTSALRNYSLQTSSPRPFHFHHIINDPW